MSAHSAVYEIDATTRTPRILLDAEKSVFILEGESYPEDVVSFFAPLQAALDDMFNAGPVELAVQVRLVYFNSSSARMLMEIMTTLGHAAENGHRISVNWFCDPDDDIMREFAEDIFEDIEAITVEIIDS